MKYQCEICSKPMNEKDCKEMDEVRVPIVCSNYCYEVYNGTPMPVTQGALVFDKWHNWKQVK